jgi:hypothetical protein
VEYNGRKITYSITVNVINVDERWIRTYSAAQGVHTTTVFGGMWNNTKTQSFFSENEFIMCDTVHDFVSQLSIACLVMDYSSIYRGLCPILCLQNHW